MPLLYALRNDLSALNNPHFGCGLAPMRRLHGAYRRARRCAFPASRRLSAVGKPEGGDARPGLGTPEKPHPIQKAYVEEEVPQCGYCINGWLMTAAALLNRNKKADRCPDQGSPHRPQVPLRHPYGHHCAPVKSGAFRDDGLREANMTKIEKGFNVSHRRALLQAGGCLGGIGRHARSGSIRCSGINLGAKPQGARPLPSPPTSSPPTSRSMRTARSLGVLSARPTWAQGLYNTAIRPDRGGRELDVPFQERHRDHG